MGLPVFALLNYTLHKIGWAVRFAEVKEEALLARPGDTQQNVQPNRSPQAPSQNR